MANTLQTTTKYLLFAFCLLVVCTKLEAQIVVNAVNNTTSNSNCNGSITVSVHGDACPAAIPLCELQLIETDGLGGNECSENCVSSSIWDGRSHTFEGLCAGTYMVQVYNPKYECTYSGEQVEIKSCDGFSVNAAVQQACAGNTVGSVQIEIEGGAAPYIFTYTFGDFTGEIPLTGNTVEQDNMEVGTHLFSFTDASDCMLTAEVIIEEQADCIEPEFDYTVLQGPCRLYFYNTTGLPEGQTIQGWLWEFCDGTTSTEENPVFEFTSYEPCIISLSIEIADNVFTTASTQTVEPCTICPLESLTVNTNAICNDNNSETGTIELNISGGAPPYDIYSFEAGIDQNLESSSFTFSNRDFNTAYNFTISDACEQTTNEPFPSCNECTLLLTT